MDYGSDEILKGNEMYPIKEAFLNSPFQYRILNLVGLNLKFKSKLDYVKLNTYFTELYKNSLSISALVDSYANDTEYLNVHLFAQIANTEKVVFVNQNLLNSSW